MGLTALVAFYFWVRTCSRGKWSVRTSADWRATVSFFTPLFAAMHAVSHALYSAVAGAQPGKKASAHWFASHVVSMAHALVITAAALACLWLLWDAPATVKLGARAPPRWADGVSVASPRWADGYPLIAATGELFTAWLAYDLALVVGAWATLGSWETVAHHLGFLLAAALLRGYYFAPWQAAVCLSMEASTPFLNLCQLKEALGLDKRSRAVVCSFLAFALCFFAFRVLLLAAALLQLLAHWADGPWALPPTRASTAAAAAEPATPAVPELAAYALVALLCAALCMMLGWFRRIVAILLPAAHGAEEIATSDDSDGDAQRTRRTPGLSDDEEIALVAV
ncbi:hypothetical protein KFE25_009293 [Diacronema lutheri]|nr:hypothetical protein KFE25_009293 [Diacronema lutheri]